MILEQFNIVVQLVGTLGVHRIADLCRLAGPAEHKSNPRSGSGKHDQRKDSV
jgi:hypothetical protein